MRKLNYADFRKRIDPIFDVMEDTNSISYQLIGLSDLFQKIATIYKFALEHPNSSFHNSIIFQVVESALLYGVCVPIRRLADGGQINEISLFKIVHELKGSCIHWTRKEFVTWDGQSYETSELRRQHREEVDRLLKDNMKKGILAAWVPRGEHEESDRRHETFDLLSKTSSPSLRSPSDRCDLNFPNYLLSILHANTRNVSQFANRHLVHRVHLRDQIPQFNVSLKTIEETINSLYYCFNILNSVFTGGHMSPDLVHQYDIFDKLSLALVEEADQQAIADEYEIIKARMEAAVNAHDRTWMSDLQKFST